MNATRDLVEILILLALLLVGFRMGARVARATQRVRTKRVASMWELFAWCLNEDPFFLAMLAATAITLVYLGGDSLFIRVTCALALVLLNTANWFGRWFFEKELDEWRRERDMLLRERNV